MGVGSGRVDAVGVEVDDGGLGCGRDDAAGVDVGDGGAGSGRDDAVGVEVDDGGTGSGVEQPEMIKAAIIKMTAISCFVDIASGRRDSNATLYVSFTLRQALWNEG